MTGGQKSAERLMEGWMNGWMDGRDGGREEEWLGQQTSIFESCSGQGKSRPQCLDWLPSQRVLSHLCVPDFSQHWEAQTTPRVPSFTPWSLSSPTCLGVCLPSPLLVSPPQYSRFQPSQPHWSFLSVRGERGEGDPHLPKDTSFWSTTSRFRPPHLPVPPTWPRA